MIGHRVLEYFEGPSLQQRFVTEEDKDRLVSACQRGYESLTRHYNSLIEKEEDSVYSARPELFQAHREEVASLIWKTFYNQTKSYLTFDLFVEVYNKLDSNMRLQS